MSAENSQGSSTTAFSRILSDGYAIVRLDLDEARRLAELYRESCEFFALETDRKLRYSVPNRVSGYRPHGYAHAGSPDKPDLNDSFLYWKRRRESLPHREEIDSYLDAAEAYRVVAAKITDDVVNAMCQYYEYEHELSYESASVLQVNSFAEPTDRELLQLEHEDAVLLTVISTSEEGLEGVFGGNPKSFDLAPDEVLVMPGSVMTLMTGGRVQPFFHQVRNHQHPERKSVMYFVSPDTDRPIEPFVRNETNEGVDIRALVIENPQEFFGLAEDFVTAEA
ncbi:MAG TPA: 2OG-Fe(II) oxygenase family protein [Actinocrinis sp.]|nr:2OG-Fe(II) oxygenase family protein [Actinocrinis sp.]